MADLPVHHERFAKRYRDQGEWIAGPVPDMLAEHAAASPDKIALVDRIGSMTYAELNDAADRLACAFVAMGLGRQDRVAIQLPNWREFAIAQQAALRIGAAYVPLLPQLREADVRHAIEASGARMLVVPAVFKGFDHAAMARQTGVANVLIVGDSFERALSGGLVAAHAGNPGKLQPDADDLRVILFTSGTEAKSKGVLHSFNTQYVGLKRHVRYFDLSADDVIMCVSPVGHGTGAVNGVEFAIHLGATVIMQESWEPEAGLRGIIDSGATMMWGATTFYSDLVKAAATSSRKPTRFRYAFTAGAPVPAALAGAVREKLGALLVTAYGQSEGQNIAITRPDDPVEKITDSDGRFHDCVEWKLVDSERRQLPAGKEGEIAYRGPNVCLGYLDPAHTAAAIDADGFIYSGDIGVVDSDDYLRIVGRRKDIIIRGGENISPAEVEGLLFGHPMIDKVSVIGLSDDRLGQRACAVVVPRQGMHPQLADIVDYLAERKIAKFKFPERLMIVDEMPMTPSGKIRKDILRQLVEQSLA